MALLDDVSLKLLFVAENNAQDAIDTLVASLGDLTELLTRLEDLNPFVGWIDSAAELDDSLAVVSDSMDTLAQSAQSAGDEMARAMAQTAATMGTSMQEEGDRVVTVFDTTSAQASQALSALEMNARTVAEQISAQYTQVSDEMKTQMVAAAQEIASISVEAGDSIETALQGAAQAAKDVAMDLGLIPSVFTDLTSEAEQFNATLEQTAATAQDVATATKEALSGGGATTSGASGGHGSLGSTVLMGGMNAMMGYYGLQMLANSGLQWSSIEQMQKLNNSTPQQAAQMMAMMGMAGMTGSSAVSFLSGMAGQLQQTFTPQVGTGMLSQQAILLESLGINQQDVAQSPAMLLNTIAQRYSHLQTSGQGSKAAELLSLTGTSQLGALFQNWSSAQQETSGLIPGMTSKDVQQAAKQGLTMTAAMEKLSLAFSELAITLIPLIQPLVTAFSRVVSFFTSGGSELQRIGRLLTGVAASFAAINVAKLLFGKVVPAMNVNAGVVNLAGAPAAGVAAGAADGEAGAAGAAGGGLLESLGLGGLITAAATAFGKLRASAALTWGSISKLGGTLGDFASGALDTVAGAFSDLGGILTTVGDVVGGVLLTAFDAISWPIMLIVAALTAVGVGIYELITHWKQVTAWLGKMGADFSHWVSQTSSNIGNWTTKTSGDFTKWAGGTLKNLGNWISTTTGDFKKWSGDTIKSLGDWMSKTSEDFTKWAATTFKSLGHWVSQTTTSLITWSKDANATIKQWGQTAWQHLQVWAQNTGSVIDQWTQSVAQWVGSMVSTVQSMVSAAGNMIRNVGSSIGNWVSNTVKSVGQTISQSLFGNGQTPTSQKVSLPGNVTSWIQSAMKDAGVGGGQWLTGLTAMVAHESGGNPNAVNPLGINPTTGQIMKAGGEHATGIAQMLMSTFQAYMKPGMNNILNPIDNLVASIRYIQSRYGGIGGMEKASGLLTGNYKGYAAGGLISETIAGLGLSSGQQYLFGEAGPEYILPMTGTEGAGGAGSAPIINVTVQAMTNDPQQLGRIVAQEIVSQVKRRGNFSWRP